MVFQRRQAEISIGETEFFFFRPPFFAENVKKFSSRRNRRLPFPSIQTEGDAPFLSVDI